LKSNLERQLPTQTPNVCWLLQEHCGPRQGPARLLKTTVIHLTAKGTAFLVMAEVIAGPKIAASDGFGLLHVDVRGAAFTGGAEI
jgi:hypothetical protein